MLEDIGFYTLSDYRATQTSQHSPLWRCELILLSGCNFHCKYCRGLPDYISGYMPEKKAIYILSLWFENGLRNVRFSGGEPTLHKPLLKLVNLCSVNNVKHIAISTNGSASLNYYKELFYAGVNDFSISLDSCCALENDKITGTHNNSWDKIVYNITELSKLTYVTVGCVVTEDNLHSCSDTVNFISSLGVADIRIIPSAQYNKLLTVTSNISDTVLNQHPILKYRINNVRKKRNVRGISKNDCHKCWLALDDMAIADNYHFPCIIYMREWGKPIGIVDNNIRKNRYEWIIKHDTHNDSICRNNCLDVCIDYNNKANRRIERLRKQRILI